MRTATKVTNKNIFMQKNGKSGKTYLKVIMRKGNLLDASKLIFRTKTAQTWCAKSALTSVTIRQPENKSPSLYCYCVFFSLYVQDAYFCKN